MPLEHTVSRCPFASQGERVHEKPEPLNSLTYNGSVFQKHNGNCLWDVIPYYVETRMWVWCQNKDKMKETLLPFYIWEIDGQKKHLCLNVTVWSIIIFAPYIYNYIYKILPHSQNFYKIFARVTAICRSAYAEEDSASLGVFETLVNNEWMYLTGLILVNLE